MALKRSARLRVVVAALVGIASAVAGAALGSRALALLIGWDAAAFTYITWVWLAVGRLSDAQTERHAGTEDPGAAFADVVLLVASVASLLAVGLVIAGASGGHTSVVATVGLAVVSVVLSWTVVHTVFMLRYARLYYSGASGGIDFNGGAKPRYADFAYLAFTIGMTFQVSDTGLRTSRLRATALQQALLSYLFGTVIVATTINLVVGLGK